MYIEAYSSRSNNELIIIVRCKLYKTPIKYGNMSGNVNGNQCKHMVTYSKKAFKASSHSETYQLQPNSSLNPKDIKILSKNNNNKKDKVLRDVIKTWDMELAFY